MRTPIHRSSLIPVMTDLNELSLGSTMRIDFPNRDDILNFTLTIEPDEGMYKGGSFTFTFTINQNFPHDPPKVKCTQKIYHPNIDLEGNVCLNILREDWKPVLNLNAVIVGMQVCTLLQVLTREILKYNLVPVLRTKCLRSLEQGGCRRSTNQPRRFPTKRSNSDGRRVRQRAVVRPSTTVATLKTSAIKTEFQELEHGYEDEQYDLTGSEWFSGLRRGLRDYCTYPFVDEQ